MTMRQDTDPLEQAAHWFATLADEAATEADRRQWRRWLRGDPANRRAWARVEEFDRCFRQVPAEPARHALGAAGRTRRRVLGGLAGLALVPVGWTLGRSLPGGIGGADLRTAVGDVREVPLPGGGRLWLNTATAVNLDYGQGRRRISLLAGEAHIRTGAGEQPLDVHTPFGHITPLGTEFTVRIAEDGARVAVSAGRVAVTSRLREAPLGAVAPGEAMTFDAGGVIARSAHSPGHEGWVQGVLIADEQPLGAFLDNLARYRHGVVRYDERAAALTLVGAFPLHDTDRILDVLEESLPVRVSRLTPWWVKVEGL